MIDFELMGRAYAQANEITKDLDEEIFLPVICMLIEENCKAHGTDCLEVMERILEAGRLVNEEFGAY